MRTTAAATVLVLAAVIAGCGGPPQVTVTDDDVDVVLDVDEALSDGGGFRFRLTRTDGYPFEGGTEQELVIEGQRDIDRRVSRESRRTTFRAEAPADSVDEHLSTLDVTSESAVTGGSQWFRGAPVGGVERPWAEVGPVDWGGPDDLVADEVGIVLDLAASVERYEVVESTDEGRGLVLTHLRGVGEQYEYPTEVDLWMDDDGLIHRVATEDSGTLDMWDHGREVVVELGETSSEPPDGTQWGAGLYPEVVGDWEVEAQGALGGRAWVVQRSEGVMGGVAVPCRLLLSEAVGAGWDDVELAVDDDAAVCGRGGYGGLLDVVADPALQILPPAGAWDATDTDVLPLAVVVSPRLGTGPVVLRGADGEEISTSVDAAGIGVAALPGDVVVTEVELAGGSVRCTTGLSPDWFEEGYHAAPLLAGVSPTCVEG